MPLPQLSQQQYGFGFQGPNAASGAAHMAANAAASAARHASSMKWQQRQTPALPGSSRGNQQVLPGTARPMASQANVAGVAAACSSFSFAASGARAAGSAAHAGSSGAHAGNRSAVDDGADKGNHPLIELADKLEFYETDSGSEASSGPGTPARSLMTFRNKEQPAFGVRNAGNGGRSNVKELRRSSSVGGGNGRKSSSTCYLNFDEFDMQIEDGNKPNSMLSWSNLPCQDAFEAETLAQSVEMYGWETPSKFQTISIPAVSQSARRGCKKSYTFIQSQQGKGKSSSLVLGLLCEIKRSGRLQAVIMALDSCQDIEKYFSIFSAMDPVRVECMESPEPESSDLKKAENCQVLIGHPKRVCALLQHLLGSEGMNSSMQLEDVQILALEDLAKLIADCWIDTVTEINQLISMRAKSALRYIVFSDFAPKEAKQSLRVLKSSLMNRKNMFNLSAQVGRLKKNMKHYVVEADPSEWLQILMQLRGMIFIPRAVVFSDDPKITERYARVIDRMRSQAGSVVQDRYSAKVDWDFDCAVLANAKGAEYGKMMRDFAENRVSFLLCKTEPNIFQMSLPRVFFIIHFGLDPEKLSHYGCRLCCLDESLKGGTAHQSGVSVLFLPPNSGTIAPDLEKLFSINFTPLPFEVQAPSAAMQRAMQDPEEPKEPPMTSGQARASLRSTRAGPPSSDRSSRTITSRAPGAPPGFSGPAGLVRPSWKSQAPLGLRKP